MWFGDMSCEIKDTIVLTLKVLDITLHLHRKPSVNDAVTSKSSYCIGMNLILFRIHKIEVFL